MTGLEKMVSQILEDAKQTADAEFTGSEGRSREDQADAACADARSLCRQMSRGNRNCEVQNYLDRTASSADL